MNWFLFESGEIVFTRIYDVRTRLKVKQDELAKLSGVSQSQISKYEKGEVTNPSYDKLVRIAEALGVSVDDLRTQKEEQDSPPVRQTTSAVHIPYYDGRTDLKDFNSSPSVRLGFNRVAYKQIRKPSFLEYSNKAYACSVYGDDMYPRYRQGDIVFVDPNLKPQTDDNAVISFKIDGSFFGLVREIISISDDAVVFKDLNNSLSSEIKRSRINDVQVIVGVQYNRVVN